MSARIALHDIQMLWRSAAWRYSSCTPPGWHLSLPYSGRFSGVETANGPQKGSGGRKFVDQLAVGVLAALRLPGQPQVFEMGVGLALGHGSPRPWLEQLVREIGDGGRAQLTGRLAQLLHPLDVMQL